MKNNAEKYVITLWKNEYDYEGLTSCFEIVGSYNSLDEAKNVLLNVSHNEIEKQLKNNDHWNIMDVEGKTQNMFSESVNKHNKVLHSYEMKTGDDSGFNSIYSFYEIIEIPQNTIIDEKLFDTKDSNWEIKSYFNKKN